MKIHVGAIFLYEGRIRAVGYNGTLPGYRDCFDGGCVRCNDENISGGEQLDRCVCVHAEENGVASAARYGIPIEGTECYVTHEPCLGCTKLLVQAGVDRVAYLMTYTYEIDEGIDRNEVRRELLDHQATRIREGKKGTKVIQYSPPSHRASEEAVRWAKRLDQMKHEAKEHCRSVGKLIPKRPDVAEGAK